MGYKPDMKMASEDEAYAARVFQDHIQTGNVSVFDRSAFEYATAGSVHSSMDTLVDNVIVVWGHLDGAYCALMDLTSYWWDKGRLDSWQLAVETLLEVKEEFEMVEEWLEAGDDPRCDA